MPLFDKEIPDDVWLLIFKHLQRPPPLPLSRPSGRQSLQQPHLAILMRTSKVRPARTLTDLQLFNSLAENLLYTHVFTDSLSLTLAGWNGPTPGRLFGLTQSLHLEFEPRDEEPTYKMLLERRLVRLWSLVGTNGKWPFGAYTDFATIEVWELTECLEMVAERGSPFPKLERVAVDAIRDAGARIWRHVEKVWRAGDSAKPILDCIRLFNNFLHDANPQHVCMRASNSPFQLHKVSYASVDHSLRSRKFIPTIHFSRGKSHFTLPLGGKVRWVSDEPDGQDMAMALWGFASCADNLLGFRRHSAETFRRQGLAVPPDVAYIDVYCSTSRYGPKIYDLRLVELGLNPFDGGPTQFTDKIMTLEEKQSLVATMQKKAQELLRRNSGVEDVLRWHLSEEFHCLACGHSA